MRASSHRRLLRRANRRASLLVLLAALGVTPLAQSDEALVIRDFLTLPMTGSPTADGNPGSLARVSMMREEPGGTGRLFVNDLNGPLYIVDKTSHAITTYLDFNGRGDRPGLFARLPYAAGYQNGFIAFAFDPDYSRNGVFYTLHMEEPAAPGPAIPINRSFPGLNLAGYTATTASATPGDIQRESVLVEWTDTNVRNTTFEGTAREVLRIAMNTRIHPCGDLIFNPTARRGDADWRTLYVGCGDGGSGEQMTAIRQHPQRLDTLVGKILRIVPDPALRPDTTAMSDNGRYRIPRDNPFVGVAGARPEIWAYGFRNPHRLTWDVDPTLGDHLIAANIGLNTWESIDIVHRGANYGYPAREGSELLRGDNKTAPAPPLDELPVQVSDTKRNGVVVPRYPVVEFPHTQDGGDAISGGYVYRGALLHSLIGKYVFGDITTGKVWYADLQEMLAADDTNPATLARRHPLQLRWENPTGTPSRGPQLLPSMFQVVLAGYKARGGTDPDLPGRSTVSGPGRADIRFAVDGAGELYILSKADGMIRAVTSVATTAPARN